MWVFNNCLFHILLHIINLHLYLVLTSNTMSPINTLSSMLYTAVLLQSQWSRLSRGRFFCVLLAPNEKANGGFRLHTNFFFEISAKT